MIPPESLTAVLARVAASPQQDYAGLQQALRGEFTGMHITVCGEDDIPPRLSAVAENDLCQLYFVDASEHCLKLTSDAEAASGIVVALRGDED
jgi:hypothetical protein